MNRHVHDEQKDKRTDTEAREETNGRTRFKDKADRQTNTAISAVLSLVCIVHCAAHEITQLTREITNGAR